MSIGEIIELEPDIGKVMKLACQMVGDGWMTYSFCKKKLYPLVGWEARNEKLRTCDAYETTIMALCDVLKL